MNMLWERHFTFVRPTETGFYPGRRRGDRRLPEGSRNSGLRSQGFRGDDPSNPSPSCHTLPPVLTSIGGVGWWGPSLDTLEKEE